MKTVDLNCDLGESFGNYKCGMDEEILPFITSANVACGFHASDPVVMSKTVKNAVKNHVRVGAHPGFPDLVGFGRRKMDLSTGRDHRNHSVPDRCPESFLCGRKYHTSACKATRCAL